MCVRNQASRCFEDQPSTSKLFSVYKRQGIEKADRMFVGTLQTCLLKHTKYVLLIYIYMKHYIIGATFHITTKGN